MNGCLQVKEYINQADGDKAEAQNVSPVEDDDEVQVIEEPSEAVTTSNGEHETLNDEPLDVKSSPRADDDDQTTNEATQESAKSGDGGLVLPILMFTTLESRYNIIDCLESLKPRYVILYHTDIATTRIIEVNTTSDT